MAKTTTVKEVRTKSSVNNNIKKKPAIAPATVKPTVAPVKAKPVIIVPDPPYWFKKVTDQLVAYFKAEVPPADYVAVVDNSIKPVDEGYGLYKALVHTTVYIAGGKEHFSNIRFKLDKEHNVIVNTITYS